MEEVKKEFPRIWDCNGERKIIGETRVSWLVKDPAPWSSSIKVAKKHPNKRSFHPNWFFSAEEFNNFCYKRDHCYGISRSIFDRYSPNASITADQLRQIADIIGYQVEEKAE